MWSFVGVKHFTTPTVSTLEHVTLRPVLRSDYTFMAVALDKGNHEIELKIENPKYILASNITIISWIFIFLLIAVHSVFIIKAGNDKKKV